MHMTTAKPGRLQLLTFLSLYIILMSLKKKGEGGKGNRVKKKPKLSTTLALTLGG